MSLNKLDDVVASVPDGSSVYLGNFGAQLFAVGHELIRQGKRDLRLIVASGGILLDQLIGAGVTRAVTISHCWNPVGPNATPHFQGFAQEGRLQVRELTIATLCAALWAAGQGLPFATTTDLSNTDYVDVTRSGGLVSIVNCEFGSATVVRAVSPDVAFIHVDRATPDGYGWLKQPGADVLLAAMASARTVLVCEEVASGSGPATIPGLLVSDVVECRGAVRPDGAAGRYGRDIGAYLAYANDASMPQGLERWRSELEATRG